MMTYENIEVARGVVSQGVSGYTELCYVTRGGVRVRRRCVPVDADAATRDLIGALDARRGVMFSSGCEFPGRYTRWDLGFVDPPVELSATGRRFALRALNARGRVLLPVFATALGRLDALEEPPLCEPDRVAGLIRRARGRFPEEQRSRQPSVFSVLRVLRDVMHGDEDRHLGFYGAFGYDLCFQFEPMVLSQPRAADARDLVLYLPDHLVVVDRQKERAGRFFYEFEASGESTEGLSRDGEVRAYRPDAYAPAECDHAPGDYAAAVGRAREAFRRGDLFELVLSQTFRQGCAHPPSTIFRTLQQSNPAPYAFLLNLGQGEHLVGASPEMFVRVEGDRVETCPISGTISRGQNALEDAQRIIELLSSEKDESELTMCTDVDRNDKNRICLPGSVEIIGRRQIELYSRLIHTVDHVEGRLRPEFDALDAFLSHAWAVTVTGAPKPAAIARIESEEKSARVWYGGAVGVIGCNGNLNTGLTLRTVRLKQGVAEVRVGATLLYDSDPETEELETRLKASAFLDAVAGSGRRASGAQPSFQSGAGLRVLLVDHEDSFVHSLANYLRRTGAEVATLRWSSVGAELDLMEPQLIVLSPGPGRPSDFALGDTIRHAIARRLPIFGVCLGLQGLVEHFGGELGVLERPVHGKASAVRHDGSPMFDGIPSPFLAGRYHSLFARAESLPGCLEATAYTEDGVVMSVQHQTLPIAAVQFHPESLLTLQAQSGLRLLNNAVSWLLERSRSDLLRSA